LVADAVRVRGAQLAGGALRARPAAAVDVRLRPVLRAVHALRDAAAADADVARAVGAAVAHLAVGALRARPAAAVGVRLRPVLDAVHARVDAGPGLAGARRDAVRGIDPPGRYVGAGPGAPGDVARLARSCAGRVAAVAVDAVAAHAL